MAVNVWFFRKWGSFLMIGLFSVIGFFIGIKFYGFTIGILIMMACLLTASALANFMLKNPFSQMMEGKGILTLDINSTGVIRPFIVSVLPPYIKGKSSGKGVFDVFDRATVMNIAAPQVMDTPAQQTKDGGLTLALSEEEYNRGRFALFHFPCLIWNSQIQSIVTKDFISNNEKETFAEHTILFLNRKMEELTGLVRDFGRYVVEMTKPSTPWYKNGWVIGVIAVVIIIMVAMFAPAVINAISNTAGTAQGAIAKAGSGAITPLG